MGYKRMKKIDKRRGKVIKEIIQKIELLNKRDFVWGYSGDKWDEFPFEPIKIIPQISNK